MREELHDPRVNPRLAADLSKVKDKQAAADLSKDAIQARDRTRRMKRAAAWARKMKRNFKGITGAPSKPDYIKLAILRDPVLREEYTNEGD